MLAPLMRARFQKKTASRLGPGAHFSGTPTFATFFGTSDWCLGDALGLPEAPSERPEAPSEPLEGFAGASREAPRASACFRK